MINKKGIKFSDVIKQGIAEGYAIKDRDVLYVTGLNIIEIGSIDVQKYCGLTNEIILDDNHISKVTKFQNNIARLQVRNNGISLIQIFKSINVEKLDLSYNKITSIDGFDVKNLTSLALSYNKITSIDGFDVKNLTSLAVAFNVLSSINTLKISNLKLLIIKGNPLTHINPKILNQLKQKVNSGDLYIDIDLNQFDENTGNKIN